MSKTMPRSVRDLQHLITRAAGTVRDDDHIQPLVNDPNRRLTSLDAYRGFIMLAMASGAFGFVTLAENPAVVDAFQGSGYDRIWRGVWRVLAYQFEHVAWTGCSFWDLIQPSFMFMVGVAMPFSSARRSQLGQSRLRRFVHVIVRSAILIVLGIFLSSNGRELTNFTFVNVLTQIGLGYPFLYVFRRHSGSQWSGQTWLTLQGAAAVIVLCSYWGWFQFYSIGAEKQQQLEKYVTEQWTLRNRSQDQIDKELELMHGFSGIAGHWNKHVNAAAAWDRHFLNSFPRMEQEWHDQRFWVNEGGYQTLNFIPSLATMLFGLMAGHILRSDRSPGQNLRWMLAAGLICFAVAFALDSTIWPFRLGDWSLCPAVKRIWTPTWALFSSGWTFWMLAAFYLVVDVWGWRRLAWPLTIVGMNSIAIYCMSQLLGGWTRETLKTHLATCDKWLGLAHGPHYLITDSPYAPLTIRVAVLFVFWLVCLWMYRAKIFVRI